VTRRRAALTAIGLWLAFATSCTSLSTARGRVAELRPDVDLSNVRVVAWPGTEAALQAPPAGSREVLHLPFLRQVIAAQKHVLARLGCLAGEEGEPLAALLRDDSPAFAAYVLPWNDAIIARSGAQRRVQTMAHELGHIASWYRGYWRIGAARVPLQRANATADASIDPHFVDLDALLAAWAFEEGVAEATAQLALAPAGDRAAAVTERQRELRTHQVVNPPMIIAGPSFAVIGERTYQVPAGETRTVNGGLTHQLVRFAYGTGLRHVILQADPGQSCEDNFARAWRQFAGTTRQILTEGRDAAPSKLAASFREGSLVASASPTGATRAGNFLLLHALTSQDATRFEQDLDLALQMVDDLVVCYGDAMLWVTDWSGEQHAIAAEQRFASMLRHAEWEAPQLMRTGSRLIATWGKLPSGATAAFTMAALEAGKVSR